MVNFKCCSSDLGSADPVSWSLKYSPGSMGLRNAVPVLWSWKCSPDSCGLKNAVLEMWSWFLGPMQSQKCSPRSCFHISFFLGSQIFLWLTINRTEIRACCFRNWTYDQDHTRCTFVNGLEIPLKVFFCRSMLPILSIQYIISISKQWGCPMCLESKIQFYTNSSKYLFS